MCIPWEGTGPCPKAEHWLFLDSSSLVFASPSFPDRQLFEPALWNSGKVMEAEWGPFPKKRNGRHRKTFVPRSPTEPCLVTLSVVNKGRTRLPRQCRGFPMWIPGEELHPCSGRLRWWIVQHCPHCHREGEGWPCMLAGDQVEWLMLEGLMLRDAGREFWSYWNLSPWGLIPGLSEWVKDPVWPKLLYRSQVCLDPVLLWLWHRPTAVAPIQSLAQELSYVAVWL